MGRGDPDIRDLDVGVPRVRVVPAQSGSPRDLGIGVPCLGLGGLDISVPMVGMGGAWPLGSLRDLDFGVPLVLGSPWYWGPRGTWMLGSLWLGLGGG